MCIPSATAWLLVKDCNVHCYNMLDMIVIWLAYIFIASAAYYFIVVLTPSSYHFIATCCAVPLTVYTIQAS